MKLIITENKIDVRLHSLVQHKHTKEIGIIQKDFLCEKSFRVYYFSSTIKTFASTVYDKNWKHIDCFVIDPDANIELNDWYYDNESINFPILENRIWINGKDYEPNIQKIIATSNSNLPILQLSDSAIDLIIRNKGILNDFEIEIKNNFNDVDRLEDIEIVNIFKK